MSKRSELRAALLGLGLALAGPALLLGCTAQSPSLTACAARANGEAELRSRLAACTSAIREGAMGDALQRALIYRGETYRLLSDADHAIEDFNRVLSTNARNGPALNDRGLVYLSKDKLDLARADFDAAIGVNPNDAFAYSNRGIVDRYEQDYDGAIHDENRAIELNPNWAIPWANRGYAYNGKRQWQMALADFNDALRLAPGNSSPSRARPGPSEGKDRQIRRSET